MNRSFAPFVAVFFFGLLLSDSSFAATYHVDAAGGDDSNSGTNGAAAWKSLARVNETIFQPGDRILVKAGTSYKGRLAPKGSGNSSNLISIGVYGEGARPRIDGEGKVLDTLLLRNVEFWEVEGLEITNQDKERQPWRTGVRIVSDGFGKMRGITVRNLYVHDVNGDLRKEQEGCGIYFESRGGNQSHFDGLIIENCHVVRTDRNGICQRTAGRARSVGVVIRRNLLEDIGGDGIKIWGSNGALVEHNVIRGGRMRCEDYAAGIWPFSSDDTLIQFNEVSGYKGTRDGQGFDSDYQCRRSVFQYNYSHDNEGGFFLICGPGNSYNEGTIIRYNVSQNDGINSARVFHFGGGSSNTLIYNNTIYIGSNQDLPLVLCTEWDRGNPKDVRFFNNIFYVDGRVTYDLGKSSGMIFENNVFCGTHVAPPLDRLAITNCPPLMKPGGAGKGMSSLQAYRFKEGTDLRGRTVENNGGRDIFGNPVPAASPPRVGAIE